MRKLYVLLVLFIQAAVIIAGPVKVIESSKELKESVIRSYSNSSIIVELPKNTTVTKAEFDKMTKDSWDIEKESNLIWLSPKSPKEFKSVLKISTLEYRDFFLRFEISPDTVDMIHSVIIKDEVLVPAKPDSSVKKLMKIPNENRKYFKEKEEKVKNKNVNKTEDPDSDIDSGKKDEYRVSLSGGFNRTSDKSSFAVKGEFIAAFRFGEGYFSQGAIFVDHNSFFKKYGMSAGVGVEPKTIGGFIFADALLYGLGDYDTTFHLQIRPVGRINISNVQLLAWLGIPVTKDQFTGVTLQDDGQTLGIYNKALMNGGVQAKAFFKKFYTEFKAMMAGNGVYSVTARVGYEIIKNLVLTADFEHSSTGNYDYIEGVNSYTTMRIAGNYYFGKANSITNKFKKCLIVDPVYPVIVQAKKPLEEEKDAAINLVATPLQGYAPLNVSFEATPSGFYGQVTMTWHFNTTFNEKNQQSSPTFIYNTPGSYTAWVEGTDEKGNYAKSNEVTIDVLTKGDSTVKYKIKATCGPNGYIQPDGEFFVYGSEDASVSFGCDDGYGVSKVTVDGKDITTLSSPYKFKNVSANHTIHVEYLKGAVPQYTITSSVKTGTGTIDPLGETTLDEGSSQKYKITPADGWSILRVLVDGESAGAVSEYEFTNLSENHVIEAEFSENPPPVYQIVASSGTNGSISPTGTVDVTKGDDAVFTITPNDGYEIDTFKVDGSTASVDSNSKYTFSNVQKGHTISVTFKRIKFTVTTSILSGGASLGKSGINTSNGDGSITDSATVYWGDDYIVDAVPVESHQIKNMTLNGASVGQVGHITLNNIKADQTVTVEFEIKKFTITASVRNNQYGSITPSGSVVVEYGSDKTFTFTPENWTKDIKQFWVNGAVQTKSGSYTFTNIKADKTIEVEFDWKYYDVGVTLEKDDNKTEGHINPGTGWFSYKANESPRFDFITDNSDTEIDYVMVNGKDKGKINFYKIDNINKDYTIRVYMKRHDVPVNVTHVGGCGVDVWSNDGQSGVNKDYIIKSGDDLTLHFSPTTSGKDYYLSVTKNGSIIFQGGLPSVHTEGPIVTGDTWKWTVKCVTAGDPPPFMP